MNGRLSFRARTFKRLAELRAVQRKKSEAQVAQSDARAKRAEAAKAKAEESLTTDEQAWRECLARADLIVAGAWAAQVTRSAQEHARLARDADSAEQALMRARKDCAHAIARARATDKIARSAVKKVAARLEEMRMQEIEDSHARKRRRP